MVLILLSSTGGRMQALENTSPRSMGRQSIFQSIRVVRGILNEEFNSQILPLLDTFGQQPTLLEMEVGRQLLEDEVDLHRLRFYLVSLFDSNMLLTTTSALIKVTTSSTADIDVCASWADQTTTAFTP
jgi:hypothetical protein